MAFFCFFGIQLKKLNGFSAAATIPAIGKQHAADISKYGIDRKFSFHSIKILLLIKLTEFSITQEERHRAFFHFSNFAGDVTLQGWLNTNKSKSYYKFIELGIS